MTCYIKNSLTYKLMILFTRTVIFKIYTDDFYINLMHNLFFNLLMIIPTLQKEYNN